MPAVENAASTERWGARRTSPVKRHHPLEAPRYEDESTAAAIWTPGLLDESHVHADGIPARSAAVESEEWHAGGPRPVPGHEKQPWLANILTSYIRHVASTSASTQDAQATFEHTLTYAQASYLRFRSYTMENIKAWASIVSMTDSVAAASALRDRRSSHGPASVPTTVLTYILGRDHLSARALRIIIKEARGILAERAVRANSVARLDELLPLFAQLTRHARGCWPCALDDIAEFLLARLPPVHASTEPKQIADLTVTLNRAMHLISLSTAVEPYKDNMYQEKALVRILRFMAEHEPPLHLDRHGYRAVVRVQLAQPKSPDERKWAELKALSWPPWKQERTAMDADITATENGVSRAADTLRQMREAGYAPSAWEEVAGVYSGWDTDKTPTVQTRALLGTGTLRFTTGEALWAARISTTRTVQEAWAAFLAYEDAKQPPSQEVYLAIFQKLEAEDRRLRDNDMPKLHFLLTRMPTPRLLPGDSREVQPLPPSTHLYTYTRTRPPTVDGLYRQLLAQGHQLSGYCLAFLVATAPGLRLGCEYLRDAQHLHPEIQGLLTLEPQFDLSRIPDVLFSSLIHLLCRHSNVTLPALMTRAPHQYRTTSGMETEGNSFNVYHPIVRVVELLRLRRPTFRLIWNHLIRALNRDETLISMSWFLAGPNSLRLSGRDDPRADREMEASAMRAYRLTRQVSAMVEEMHIELDPAGFRYLCIGAETVSMACWRILKLKGSEQEQQGPTAAAGGTRLTHSAIALVKQPSHVTSLKTKFRDLVGEDCDGLETGFGSAAIVSEKTSLLVTPSAAILHAYIRALGWATDFDGLLALTQWMVKHSVHLAEQRKRDRNAEVLMRRAIVALRVFLERSWLVSAVEEPEAIHNQTKHTDEETAQTDNRTQSLRRLESSATEEAICDMRRLVESVEDWRGWPSEEEVSVYLDDHTFERIRVLYGR